jgi:hypothetical protein
MSYTIWPLRFSTDPAAMIDFLAALGLNQTVGHASRTFATFAGRSGTLGVHDARTATTASAGRTSLNLATDDVDAGADRLRAEGLTVAVWDETYGRQGAVRSPSGLVVGLNERTQDDLYGGYELHEQTVAASMDVVAICAVGDLDREADFFGHFGFAALEPGQSYRPLLAAPDAGVIALRAAGTESSGSADPVAMPAQESGSGAGEPLGPPYLVALGAETSEPLDALADRMRAGGHPAETIEDEDGVWVRLTDPDGVILEVRPTR